MHCFPYKSLTANTDATAPTDMDKFLKINVNTIYFTPQKEAFILTVWKSMFPVLPTKAQNKLTQVTDWKENHF